MVQHPHPPQPSKYSQLRACSLHFPSLVLCSTFELILKSHCQFFLCKVMGKLLLGQKWKIWVQPYGPMEMGDGVRWGEPLAQPHHPHRQHGPSFQAHGQSSAHHVGDPWTFYQQPVAAGCPQYSVAQQG